MADFLCNVCGSTSFRDTMLRGDGHRVLFCAECGMGGIENPPASTDAFYGDGYYGGDGESTGYEDYDFTAEHTQLWVRLMVAALRPEGGRILDVGCANGALLDSLPERFELYGVEVNHAASETARRRGVDIIATDINDPAIASGGYGSFDIVTSIATFEHVLDLRRAFETCLDLLAPGGFVLFEVPLISETADNREWLHGSYEHIHYPTEPGLRRLLEGFDAFWVGQEASIKGFSSSYIGIVARDAEAFGRASELFRAMTRTDLEGLGLEERRLNLAYHVIHSFSVTPERVLALPDLLQVASTPGLLKRLTQLWHADAVGASAADYHQQQATNWQNAWRQTQDVHEQFLRAEEKSHPSFATAEKVELPTSPIQRLRNLIFGKRPDA